MFSKPFARLARLATAHPDRLSAIVLAIVAVVALISAADLPFGSLRAPDSGFFPKSLSALLLMVSIGIIVQSFASQAPQIQFNRRSWLVVLATASFIIYAVVLPKIGFVLATVAMMLLVMRGFGGIKLSKTLLIAIPSVVLTYFAFTELGVALPSGLLPF